MSQTRVPDRDRCSRRHMLRLVAATTAASAAGVAVLAACGATPAATTSSATAATTSSATAATTSSAAGKSAVAAATTSAAAPAAAAPAQAGEIVVWGMNVTTPGGDKTMAEAYNRTHQNPQLKAESIPNVAGQTATDMQKLITAISAGDPPDFTYLDRFLAVDYASRTAIVPLDQYANKGTLKPADFIKATWDECVWQGKLFAIPASEGNIGYWSLWYNRDVLRKAGIDPAAFDSAKGPLTWAQVKDYAVQATAQSGGKFERIGMIPAYGASFLYQWGWANGAEFVSPDGTKVELTDPKLAEALQFLVSFYDQLGGAQKIQGFQSGFQSGASDPFITGLFGMEVNGEYGMPNIAKYKPDLDFGVTYFPVPKAGAPTVTWAGGWSWAIPRGSKHPQDAYPIIEWLAGPDGLMAYEDGVAQVNASKSGVTIPIIMANTHANDLARAKYLPTLKQKAPNLATAYDFYYNAPQEYSKIYWRPHVVIAQALWQALLDATQDAIFHKKSVQQALSDQQSKLQVQLTSALAGNKQ